MRISSYRDLKVWQAALELAERIYGLTGDFPKSELYGLVGQMRRAGVSIASNIAEGHGRGTTAAFVQFLRVSQGSLKELETQVLLAQRLEFMNKASSEEVLERSEEIGKMLRALIRSLQERAQKND